MKITKEQFDKLYDTDISKREYDNIIGQIDSRFYEIVTSLVGKKNKQWFDYGNCDYDSEDSNGYFDPEEYREYITVGGENCRLSDPYRDGFPTRWLWEESFKLEFDRDVLIHETELEIEKNKEKSKREELKIRKLKFREVITAKLSKEELRYIQFK